MRNLEYRGFIAGVLAVLGFYALLSCWPALTALITGRAPVAQAPVARTPSSVAGSAGGALAPPPASVARTPSSLAGPSVQSLRLSAEPAAAGAGTDWKKAAGDLVLLDKPGGTGLRPASLSRAALTICAGAHVRVLGEQGGWVKVQSPSRAVGWVSAAEMQAGD